MFDSFFLAGFECATGYNVHGQWIDQVAATQHDRCVLEDYRLLHSVGIRAVRESVRWPLVDRNGGFDFATIAPCLRAARHFGLEIIWDLFHYGYPEGLDLFSEQFPHRFGDYCYQAASYVAAHSDATCYFTPVNEPSYFAWAAGEVGRFAPHAHNRGWDLKVSLARAAIQGIDAIRAACPTARIVNVDPLCRVVAPPDRPELQQAADRFNEWSVFESWDMLSGRLLPELGGSPEHLDIVGLNYYWTNQWEICQPGVPLDEQDSRCAPLRELVRSVWERYQRDVLITETGHRDEMRPVWMRQLTRECASLLDEGVPLRGVCLYPILGMPEWHAQHEWSRMGLWDLVPTSPRLKRVIYQPMLKALREAQEDLEGRQYAVPAEFEVGLAA